MAAEFKILIWKILIELYINNCCYFSLNNNKDKKAWANAAKLEFSKFNEKLKTSPYLFLFYIEKITEQKPADDKLQGT